MNRLVIATTLALAVSGPALASDQLARSIGVEPGAYTTAQLIELRDAISEDNWSRVNAIKSEATAGGYTVSSKGSSSAGLRQLEATLGVQPGAYSRAQLVELRDAVGEDNWVRANAIKKEVATGGYTVSSKSNPSAAHRQLATSLGVDANAHTLHELVSMKNDRYVDNNDD